MLVCYLREEARARSKNGTGDCARSYESLADYPCRERHPDRAAANIHQWMMR